MAALVAAGLVWFVRRRVRHMLVDGHSMAPTLLPGDRLLAWRTAGSPSPGGLVVADDPRTPTRTLIKRVHSVAGGQVELRGDNTAGSTDSRTFGALPVSAVDPCVVWRYHPPARAGRVSSSRARVRRPGRRPGARR